MGPYAAGFDDNLTSRQYRALTGPPLAPRGEHSRVIKNLKTGHGRVSGQGWKASGIWFDVVSTRGVYFLTAHFEGLSTGRNHATKLPVRDLRGVRAWGMAEAVAAMRTWAATMLREGR
jgi:hypothetical protein